MSNDWDVHLAEWTGAGLLPAELAVRIREWEYEREPSRGLRWPTLVALIFGAILVAGGVLLFVSAHWDQISPGARMTLVVAMVAVFHAMGAAVSARFEGLSVTLHAIGTATLGAAIALAGQIYNLAEHWPSAVLLWALGAALAWALLRQWPQAAFTAILAPAWLAAEWSSWSNDAGNYYAQPVIAGICALSLTYLSARRGTADSPLRIALMWIGGIALLPSALLLAVDRWTKTPSSEMQFVGWLVALGAPLIVAMLLRRGEMAWNLAAIGWTGLLALVKAGTQDHLLVYLCCATGSAGLAWWGILAARAERINLAIAGFALTVICFYFSDVRNKLDRSAGMMMMGLIFLGGGWLLERTRRNLLSRIRSGEAL